LSGSKEPRGLSVFHWPLRFGYLVSAITGAVNVASNAAAAAITPNVVARCMVPPWMPEHRGLSRPQLRIFWFSGCTPKPSPALRRAIRSAQTISRWRVRRYEPETCRVGHTRVYALMAHHAPQRLFLHGTSMHFFMRISATSSEKSKVINL